MYDLLLYFCSLSAGMVGGSIGFYLFYNRPFSHSQPKKR